MNIDKGTQFVISYIPDTINGEKNSDTKTIRRSALFDDKSKVWTTTKGNNMEWVFVASIAYIIVVFGYCIVRMINN